MRINFHLKVLFSRLMQNFGAKIFDFQIKPTRRLYFFKFLRQIRELLAGSAWLFNFYNIAGLNIKWRNINLLVIDFKMAMAD